MTRFILFLLLPFGLLAQGPVCTQKGTLTTATVFTALPNNTGNPNCNAFALTWNSTGFSAVTMQLQGADTIGGTYTAFTATSPFSNPQAGLSGTIIVQGVTKIAFLQVKATVATGTGAINFQLYGYQGVTPLAGGAGGGACATLGGDVTGSCAANTVVAIQNHAVSGVQGNGALAQLSTGTPTPSDCVVFDANGNTTDSGSPTCGGLAAALISIFGNTGPNITALLVPTGDSLGPSGTGTITATQVPAAAGATASTNGQIKYDTTAQNLHAAQGSADAIAVLTKVTPGNGNCPEWLNSGGTLNLGDSGAPCGSSSGGGGVITYSSSADTFLGTQFLPPGGGAPASSTESDVQVASPAAATISNLHVQISSALGVGVTAVFTWRDAGSSTASTCSISGNSAKSCSDTSHSFNAAAGDLLDMQVVTTGTPAAVNVLFTSAFGTSGVGVTLVSASAPLTSSGGTTPNISATYQGNGAKVQASTGTTTTNDCVKFDANGNTVDAGAACSAGGGSPGGSNSEYQYRSGASTFGAVTNSGPVPTANWVLHNCGSGAGRGTIDTFSARKVSLTTVGNTTPQTCIATQSLGAPPYTVIAQIEMEFSLAAAQGQVAGIGLYDGTKAYVIGAVFTTGTQLALSTNQIATLSTSFPQTGATQFIIGTQVTLKITDDGVHRTWYYFSGGSFVQFLQEATATFLTPTDVGIVSLNDVAVVNQTSTNLLYWCVSSSTTCNGL